MMGDGEQRVMDNVEGNNNNGVNQSRLKNALDLLKNNKHILMRRRAAEDLRIILAAHPLDTSCQSELIDCFYKTLKKSKEDTVILEQILWTVTNLSHSNSPLIHAMLPKGIVKLVARHAKNSTSTSARDQAIMCLGNFAADCSQCRFCVAKTEIHETIIDHLDNITSLTKKQINMFAWTLRNIFRPIPSQSNFVIKVNNTDKMIKIINNLISLSPPDDTVKQGIAILQEWIAVDTNNQIAALIAKEESMMNHLLELFEADDDEVSSVIIRVIGNLIFNDDDLIQLIIDYGFIPAMEARSLTSDSNLGADIFWCLSNIIGSHRAEYIAEIHSRTELFDVLVQNCYSHDARLRREAFFCILNMASFYTGEEKYEMYFDYFGRIMIDTLNGITKESDLDMMNAIGALLIHILHDLKMRSRLYKDLILKHGLFEAVKKRYIWIHDALKEFDLTPAGKKELKKLLKLCIDASKSIMDYQNLPTRHSFSNVLSPRISRQIIQSNVYSPINDAHLSQFKTDTKMK